MSIDAITCQKYIKELLEEISGNPDASFSGPDGFSRFDSLVDLMVSKTKPVYFYNNLPRQTRKILNVILTKAKQNSFLNMFIGDVNCEFYGIDLLIKLREVANSGCTVKLVLADKPGDKMLIKWRTLDESNNKIDIFYKHNYDEKLSHLYFTKDAYRIEAPHPKLDENEKVTDISPRRPARFGFYIAEDIEALHSIWQKTVLPNINPIRVLQ